MIGSQARKRYLEKECTHCKDKPEHKKHIFNESIQVCDSNVIRGQKIEGKFLSRVWGSIKSALGFKDYIFVIWYSAIPVTAYQNAVTFNEGL